MCYHEEGAVVPAHRKSLQSGNVFFALFGAVGLVGILGVAATNIMKGPVTGMQRVTKYTVAENQMIAAGRLSLVAAGQQPDGGDCDSDQYIEPVPWTTGDGTPPEGGGFIPTTIGASRQDPWGTTYGYCVWDHGTVIDNALCGGASQNRLRGSNAEDKTAIAIISAGPDRIFQTSCSDHPDYLEKESGSDDVVLSYTYAEAGNLGGGLWNLKAGDASTAEIAKKLEVKDTGGGTIFSLDNLTGIGNFIGIVTGSIASKTATQPVAMSGGLKMDSEMNVTQCLSAADAGTLRYHSSQGLQVCNGTSWVQVGGSTIPTGTIAAFAANTCPDGWNEYTPARGRFLRGRDPTGANDVVRSAGNVQADSNRAHTHTGSAASAGAHTHTGTAASAGAHVHSVDPPATNTNSTGAHTHTIVAVGDGTGWSHQSAGTWRHDNGAKTRTTNSAGAHTHSVNIAAFNSASAGAHTHSVTIASAGAHTHGLTIDADGGTESRPKNVTVVFCSYVGGGVSSAVDTLDDLSGVVLSSPQSGQVLTFDGTNWVNQNGGGAWALNGSRVYYDDGNVGIGTDNPAKLLTLSGSDANTVIRMARNANIWEVGPAASGFAFVDTNGGADSTRMFISAAGNVGIGTTAPAAKLDVAGSAVLDGTLDVSNNRILNVSGPVADSDAASKEYVDSKIADELASYDGGAGGGGTVNIEELDELYVNVGGDVMGGTLDMGGNTIVNLAEPIADGDAATKAYVDANAGGSVGIVSSQWTDLEDNSGIFYNGNVGIGTDAPLHPVHMHKADAQMVAMLSTGLAQNSLLSFFADYPGTPKGGAIGYDYSDDAIKITYGTAFSSNATGIFVKESGNVGIGLSNPTATLSVLGAVSSHSTNDPANQNTVSIHATDGAEGYGSRIRYGGNLANAPVLQFQRTGNLPVMTLDSDNVGIGTTAPSHMLHVNGIARSTQASFATSSDARVKEDIASLNGGLETILRLRPVTFHFKSEYAKGKQGMEGLKRGFIAQEVEQVVPEMVTRATEEIGAGKSVEDFRLLNNSDFTPILVKAVQDIKALLDDLLARIAKIFTLIEEMKARDDLLAEQIKSLQERSEALQKENAALKERLDLIESAGSGS